MRGRLARTSTAGLVLVLLLGIAVGLQGFERWRFTSAPRAPVGIVPITLHEVSAGVEGGSTFGVYSAIREEAAGAVVVDVSPEGSLNRLHLRQLGLASQVERVGARTVTTQGTAERTLGGPGWVMDLAEGRPEVLVLTTDPAAGVRLIDARLTDLDTTPYRASPAPERRPASLAHAVSADTAILLLLLLAGGLLVPRRSVPGPARIPVALVVGVALQVTLGLLFLPAPWSLVLLPLVGLGGSWLLARAGMDSAWRRHDLLPLLVGGATILTAALAVRSRGLLVASGDSFYYWSGARALALGELLLDDLDTKRGLALQSVHALGFGAGADGLLTLGPVLLVAATALLVLLPRDPRLRGTGTARAVAIGAGALAAGSGWMWFNALYLNSHLLVATLLLLVGALGFMNRTDRDLLGAMPAIGLAITAVVLARAEAVLIIGLLLLGTLVDADRRRTWRFAWWSAGAALVTWNALLLVGLRDGGVPLVLAIGIASGAALAAMPWLLERIPDGVTRSVPLAVGVVLWSFTAAVALTPLGAQVNFFEMVRRNLFAIEGQWYLTAPLVTLLAAFAVAATRRTVGLGPARWLVIGFVPATMLAKLADGAESATEAGDVAAALLVGGGRPGWGDSVNRMWTHVVLVALLLVIGAALRNVRTDDPQGRSAARGRGSLALVALAGTVVLVGLWWEPDHLGPVGPVAITQLHADDDAARSPIELLPGPGLVFTQTVPIPAGLTLPADTVGAQACVAVTMTDLDRPNAGDYRLHLTAGDVAEERLRAGRSQGGTSLHTLCVDLPADGALPEQLEVRIAGVSGSPGATVGLLVAGDGRFVTEARLEVDAASVDPRHPLARVVSRLIRITMTQGPVVVGLGLLGLAAVERRRTPTDIARD